MLVPKQHTGILRCQMSYRQIDSDLLNGFESADFGCVQRK